MYYIYLFCLTWEISIKETSMFPNKDVNKTSPLACGVGAGDRAGSHFHTGQPDLHSSLSENSCQVRVLSKGG